MDEQLQLRIHGEASLPTLIFLPGIHGDWTLVTSFRLRLAGQVRFIEVTYPRTLTWSLDDYAAAVEEALLANNISSGWLLGESFSSQVVWAMLKRSEGVSRTMQGGPEMKPEPAQGIGRSLFRPLGLILAGGFVRHPAPWCVRLARRLTRGASLTWLTRLLHFYARFARVRHRHAPETLASIQEFVARRTEPDRQAIVHRLNLILGNDLRAVARATKLPVFALSGLLDPIVPWPWTLHWLRRNCPSLSDTRLIWRADHNVLGTAPAEAAAQVHAWMRREVNAGTTTTAA